MQNRPRGIWHGSCLNSIAHMQKLHDRIVLQIYNFFTKWIKTNRL